MESVYVLVVLGESPAVLSELLWWLSVVERRPVAGIEVWATGRGAERLRRLTATPAWQALEERTGPLPALDDVPPEASFGFRVHSFRLGDDVMDDVRSEAEAAAVSATLHDRLRALRGELPARIPILGCLAGGRKTVSAGLQTAFCLQAGPTDRLVHVVFDATVERVLRDHGRLQDFAFPSPEWAELAGVAESEQIVVYDVPFPKLRSLVSRRLSEVLETLAWDDVWPVLEANMTRDAKAVLRRTGSESWSYSVLDAESGHELYGKTLSGRVAAMLVAMVHADETMGSAEIAAWLDEHEVGWAPPSTKGHDEQTRAGAIRGAGTALRKQLEDIPVGLERFAPPDSGFVVRDVDVIWEIL